MKKNLFQLSSYDTNLSVLCFNGIKRGVLIDKVKNMLLPIDISNRLIKKQIVV